jgi:hypothetical protein
MVQKISKTIVFNLMTQLFIAKVIGFILIKIIILMTMNQKKYKNYQLMIK